MVKNITEAQKARNEYKRKLKEIKDARKLKSIRPIKVYKELRDIGSKNYASSKQKEINAKKAKEIAKILRTPDTDYIEFILNQKEPPTISISEFVTNATGGKYKGLSSAPYMSQNSGYLPGGVPDYLQAMLDIVNTPPKRSKSSELRDLIPLINNLDVQTPSKAMFNDMITDYVPKNTTMGRRKDQLSEYIDRYAQLTNEYDTSKINFEKKLNMLKDNWGDNLGMDKKERNEYLKPFLRETVPLMEVKSKDYEVNNFNTLTTEPKYRKFKLNPYYDEK